MMILKTWFYLSIAICSVAGDCWETNSCQKDSWKVKGCGQYGRVEQSRRPCPGGQFYTCCAPESENARPSETTSAKTTRYWDCCKSSCSWPDKVSVTNPVRSCEKDGSTVLSDNNTKSGCEAGDAFVCNDQQPFFGSGDIAYGFAAATIIGQNESLSCCACYELTFTSGPVRGQQMIVQVTNTVANSGGNHFNLQIPGGGVGSQNGCEFQWGTLKHGWGRQYGGVRSLTECNQLPSQIRDGCEFRFGWFRNADNPNVDFAPVVCPAEILSRSGCVRRSEMLRMDIL